jgi:hypothetical protein
MSIIEREGIQGYLSDYLKQFVDNSPELHTHSPFEYFFILQIPELLKAINTWIKENKRVYGISGLSNRFVNPEEITGLEDKLDDIPSLFEGRKPSYISLERALREYNKNGNVRAMLFGEDPNAPSGTNVPPGTPDRKEIELFDKKYSVFGMRDEIILRFGTPGIAEISRRWWFQNPDDAMPLYMNETESQEIKEQYERWAAQPREVDVYVP